MALEVMRPFREVIFKPGLCVYSAIFKSPSQSVSDSVSLGEVQESALLNANLKGSDSGAVVQAQIGMGLSTIQK